MKNMQSGKLVFQIQQKSQNTRLSSDIMNVNTEKPATEYEL